VPFVSDSEVPSRRSWLVAALLAGLAYIAIGRWFPNPPINARGWRLAAWVLSGGVFVVHAWYEHFGRRSGPRTLAAHTATGVAIGGFGLAVFGMAHSVAQTSTVRPIWLISLVAWPAITAIPAYVVAFVAALALERIRDTNRSST
jgi:hypothetical protein